MVKVIFDVAENHHLSTPWHLNFITAKSSEEAMTAARQYIDRWNQTGVYKYELQWVG